MKNSFKFAPIPSTNATDVFNPVLLTFPNYNFCFLARWGRVQWWPGCATYSCIFKIQITSHYFFVILYPLLMWHEASVHCPQSAWDVWQRKWRRPGLLDSSRLFKQTGLRRAHKPWINNPTTDILTNIHKWSQKQWAPSKTTSQLLITLCLI